MEDTKFEILVARLDADGDYYEGELDCSVLEMDEDRYARPFAGLRYKLFAQILGTELLVRGSLEQDFTADCARCGEEFDFTLEVPDFTVSVEVKERTEIIDLTEELRESIILELPMYPLCREDCKGICHTCGKNLNNEDCSCEGEVSESCWSALDALRGTLEKEDQVEK
jgi:uncharacterized protein